MSIIKKLRKALQMSQEAFAKAVGKSYASIRNYEDGRNVPPEVMAKMLGLASKAGLVDLRREIETWAADLYDRPINPEAPEAPIAGESPADRERLHALLDFVLDGADLRAAQALRETVRVYFRAARCAIDPFSDISHDDFVEGERNPELTGERRRYKVILPVTFDDGIAHEFGEIIELDISTAMSYSHALLSVEEDSAQPSTQKIA